MNLFTWQGQAEFLKQYPIWGSTRDGMSMGGVVTKAAILDTGTVMLISAGAVERNNFGKNRF